MKSRIDERNAYSIYVLSLGVVDLLHRIHGGLNPRCPEEHSGPDGWIMTAIRSVNMICTEADQKRRKG